MSKDESTPAPNFIRHIIDEDMASNKWGGRVQTRFPPEPNGYLHIGHAKSMCLNYGLALDYQGICTLRFDDTNPLKEDTTFVESILADVQWMGFCQDDRVAYASNYFDQLYAYALELIKRGLAYVDDLTPEEIRSFRGTLTEPGKDSPFRNRSTLENLDLFERMHAGEFPDGSRVLRAKIDMASPNLHMRDPTIYRIRHAHHHRTGDKWCIYPMYDYTHCLSDSVEGVTHSICTLEFEDNRALYDWVLDSLEVYHPQQIEFARLNLEYTVLSKRWLITLVKEGLVDGWDDPRMPTLVGMRRRGYTPEAIREFCERIGVGKRDSWVGLDKLEKAIRDDLNARVKRVMVVQRPLKLVITNYPEDLVEEMDAPYFPDDPPQMGYRKVPFSREIYIEAEDFLEDPPKKFWRLAPGREVRLRWAYLITCQDVVKDPDTGEISEVHCTYDPATKGGDAPDGRKVKGTLHWVSARHALDTELRLFEPLFTSPRPLSEENKDLRELLNPDSLQILAGAKAEPSLAQAAPGDKFQCERVGFFCVDSRYSAPGRPVMNRTVTLRDSWAKIVKKEQTTN
ncbi:MAG: glutamine--tRNA ligase/YqeY domain fusion protein [Deltaproteobacteria bacterium]|nr:glutamine--tRNA ligase/YqeY domain fusion protein [Deltaproteobacteria bacterium]